MCAPVSQDSLLHFWYLQSLASSFLLPLLCFCFFFVWYYPFARPWNYSSLSLMYRQVFCLVLSCSVKKSVVEEAWDALRCCRSEDNCSSVRVPLLSSVVSNSIFENSPRWTEVQWATWIQNVLLICYVVWKIFIFKILGILIELFLMKSVPLVRELFPVMLSQDA